MFKYKTNNTEGSASNVIRETRAVPVMDKVKEGMLLRPVDIEHTDEFGTYKLRLLHDISGTFIEILNVEFEPEPLKKEE